MPTKVTPMKLEASGIDILNAIRKEGTPTYQERIPVATRENIREIGNAMLSYQATANEFLNALVNRIGRVIITSKSYSNPLKMFKKGMLEYGETVEEIFVKIAKAHNYDPATAESNVFKREIPDVQAAFHKLNLKNFYKTTVSNEDLRTAFLSPAGITDLVGKIVDSLYTGSEFDEYLTMKNLIVDDATRGRFFPVHIPAVNAENAKSIVSTIKGVSNKLEFMSDAYNYMGVPTHTPKEDQIILLDASFDAVIDVEVLASAFNMDKAQFMGQRVLVDNFGSLTGVVAAIVDKNWFMVFDAFNGFTENYNGEGLYWNYWYHVWKIFSTSPFANAVLFTTEDIGVTSVTVSPASATVKAGGSYQFTAAVESTGYLPEDSRAVDWSVTGNSSTSTTIDKTGLLKLGEDESGTITVKAVSVFDSSKFGSGSVTVSA